MMEVHDLYFDFVLPWWTKAVQDPASKFPKTMGYLDTNFHGKQKKMKKRQIIRGIKAGCNELIKMTTPMILSGPVSFLILCNGEHGPSFLRALLSVLIEQDCSVILIQEPDSEKWGKFCYEDPKDRPEEERKWHAIMTEASNNFVHFWRQFFLDQEVVMADLQQLSKVTDGSKVSGDPR